MGEVILGFVTSFPPDNHVHSQFSWDALAGSMEATCERAVRIGLPALAFTEHADFTAWPTGPGDELPEQWRPLVSDGLLVPPPLDLAGYRECLERCRMRFPGLRILSGVELGEPHWHRPAVDALLGEGSFDRVLASVHSVTIGPVTAEISQFLAGGDPAAAMRAYLAEAAALVSQFGAYDVLAHVDYPVRNWPAGGRPFDPFDFREEYRGVLRLLARAGKALEVNTRVPLHPQILAWWREDGGQAITFASDAHSPDRLAAGFAEAVRVAEAAGFGAGNDPLGLWHRT
jgi:histidinol-phosphatase (PHP family)